MAGYDSSARKISPQPDAGRIGSECVLIKFENYLRLEKRAAESTVSSYTRVSPGRMLDVFRRAHPHANG
jgi:hypothetical protein